MTCAHCTDKVVFRIIQRELVLLIVLGGLTVPLFFFTRSIAATNRAMNVEVAHTWYGRAQEQLKEGHTTLAIDFLRKAATNDHDNPQYTLALASALATANYTEEARQSLLRLRMSAPESGEINLSLARLAAKGGMMDEAVRYYHNALYGVWPTDQISTLRTSVRTELVGFLLSSGDTSRALSELLILSSDIPDNDQAHIQVGRSFLAAGDSQHALEQFKRALQLNSKSKEAYEGAGRASFALTDYATARRYLDAAIAGGDKTQATEDLLQTSRFVLSRDPLIPRLATSERVRRLEENLSFVSDQLDSCIGKKETDQSSLAVLVPLRQETARSIEEEFTPPKLREDAERFRIGMNLVYRIETAVNELCKEPSDLDRALVLIARKHGIVDQ
jgi:tetratricopeptide (TPR) repeat protein